jgi:hypothetical protein
MDGESPFRKNSDRSSQEKPLSQTYKKFLDVILMDQMRAGVSIVLLFLQKSIRRLAIEMDGCFMFILSCPFRVRFFLRILRSDFPPLRLRKLKIVFVQSSRVEKREFLIQSLKKKEGIRYRFKNRQKTELYTVTLWKNGERSP